MFKIYDGREKFYQWDIERQLIVEDPSITEVHFCNRTDSCSLVCETYVEDGVTLVNVPNVLLTTDWKIHVYAYDGKHTKHDECFEVVSRTKPSDYVYTETEVKRYEDFENRITALEEKECDGVGAATADNGEIFNDYENNKALSTFSHASGENTVAGSKGFKITKSFEVSTVGNASTGVAVIQVNSTDGLENKHKGASCTLRVANEWDYGVVLQSFDTNAKTITLAGVSKNAKYEEAADNPNTHTVENYIVIHGYPELGDIDVGHNAYAGGYKTYAQGRESFVAGRGNKVVGQYGAAFGRDNITGYASFTEGRKNRALGTMSHAEGHETQALATSSHTEGYNTFVSEYGYAAHAEGSCTVANGTYSHAEGKSTRATGASAHTEGEETIATNSYAHAEGYSTEAKGISSHAEGYDTAATGWASHAEGLETIATRDGSHAEGNSTEATGMYSHAEGNNSVATASGAHAEGNSTEATAIYSHAEGDQTDATAQGAHAEGYLARATAFAAHAEGGSTEANASYAHAEGYKSKALGYSSHAEGNSEVSEGASYGHAEGQGCKVTAKQAHAEGNDAKATAWASHAEGIGTIASGAAQHVQGKYNVVSDNYAHIVGNGSGNADDKRKNIHTIDWNGNAWFAGEVEGTALILKSPGGKRFKITVSDAGAISATAI
jgi:hypothetical protein